MTARPQHTGARPRRRLTATAASALAAGLALAAPAAAAAQGSAPRVTAALRATLPAFTPPGGWDTLTVTTTGARSCDLSTLPRFPAGAKVLPCGRQHRITTSIPFPPNAKSVPATYTVTLTAKAGTAVATAHATVIVEGSDWRAVAKLRAAPYAVDSISCSNPNDCVLTSYNGEAAHLTAAGATWTNPDNTLPKAPETGLASVSCVPGEDFCVALDYSGNFLVFNGTTWTAPVPLYQSGGVTAHPWRIDCMALPVASGGGNQCVAVGICDVYVATFQSTTTVVATAIPIGGPPRVACATPALCVAVGFNGRAVVLSNGVWSTTPQVLDRAGTVLAVSCAPDHGCVATDQHSNIVDFSLRGGMVTGIVTHSVYSILHHSVIPQAVSCVMSYCLVALDNGGFVQGIRGAWYASTSVKLLPEDTAAGVSCATSATTVWCASTSEGVLVPTKTSQPLDHLTSTEGTVVLTR
jgi:hypothetical protein